ncbi:MAG: hypothetical protein FRX49_07297 [Trebouxia sp. A1-2]|nr:MAG: hypothetical protein FRX49_07297 [Trebouxia sp. A1-2]
MTVAKFLSHTVMRFSQGLLMITPKIGRSEGSEALLAQDAGSVPVRGIPNTVIVFSSGKAPGIAQVSGNVPAFMCIFMSGWIWGKGGGGASGQEAELWVAGLVTGYCKAGKEPIPQEGGRVPDRLLNSSVRRDKFGNAPELPHDVGKEAGSVPVSGIFSSSSVTRVENALPQLAGKLWMPKLTNWGNAAGLAQLSGRGPDSLLTLSASLVSSREHSIASPGGWQCSCHLVVEPVSASSRGQRLQGKEDVTKGDNRQCNQATGVAGQDVAASKLLWGFMQHGRERRRVEPSCQEVSQSRPDKEKFMVCRVEKLPS